MKQPGGDVRNKIESASHVILDWDIGSASWIPAYTGEVLQYTFSSVLLIIYPNS